MRRMFRASLVLILLLAADPCWADFFGSGGNSFEIEFVPIGQPGNPPDADPNPAGAVPYSYRIGKYEISEQMIDKANTMGGLGITKRAHHKNSRSLISRLRSTRIAHTGAQKIAMHQRDDYQNGG